MPDTKPSDPPIETPPVESKPPNSAAEPTPSASSSPPTTTAGVTTEPKADLPPELKTVHSSPSPARPKSPTTGRPALLSTASKFLADPSVNAAPQPKKLSFLESKGLSREEANSLLSTTAAAPSPPPPPPPPAIITYPEYISPPPPAPQPLVSGQTLIKSLYFSAASAASLYAANKLVITPMLDAVTAARHEFARTVSSNLDGLVSRLAELAPERTGVAASRVAPRPGGGDEDDESLTELFHVDVGTQTTDSLADEDTGRTTSGELPELNEQLRTLVDAHNDPTDNELMFLLEDLTGYLEGLSYDSAVAGMYSSPFAGVVTKEREKEDPIAKVKNEIRSVKGVLLHTKNFPALNK